MNTEDLALDLHEADYPLTIDLNEADAMRLRGIVVAYGDSDDRAEFEGIIRDEVPAPGVYHIDPATAQVLPGPGKHQLEFVWRDEGDPCWMIETKIPHHTFHIMEEGEVFSCGIVFSLADMATEQYTVHSLNNRGTRRISVEFASVADAAQWAQTHIVIPVTICDGSGKAVAIVYQSNVYYLKEGT